MGRLIHRKTGEAWDVPSDEMASALAATDADGQPVYITPDGAKITMRERGIAVEVDVDDLEAVESYGARAETAGEEAARYDRARMEREHGGIANAIGTGALSLANSASLGLTDYALGNIGGDDYRTWRKENKKVHDVADLTGEIAGYALPTGLAKAPGAIGKVAKYSPVGLAERLGERIAASGIGKGAASQIARAGAGLAAEGAIVGAGETLGDYSLATSDLERERALGSLGSNVFFGAATGGAIGAGSKGVGLAIKKGKKIADEMAERVAAKRAASELPDAVKGLDLEGIRTARKAEQDLISEQIFDATVDYRRIADEVDPMLLGVEKGSLYRQKKKFDRALKNPKKFKKAPGKAVEEALQEEEQALLKILDQKDNLLEELAKKDASLIRKIDKLEPGTLKGQSLVDRYNDFAGTKLKTRSAHEVAAEDIARFREALSNGQATGLRQKALDRVPELLEANRAQQRSITALIEGATPRLTELRVAEDALKHTPKQVKGIAQQIGEGAALSAVTGGLASVGVPWTAAAVMGSSVSEKLSSMIFGKFGKAAKGAAAKTTSAVDKLLTAGAKVGEVAPPLATKILTGVRYGREEAAESEFHKSELAKAFKAREAELYAQVTMGPRGVTMKPSARKAIAAELSGVKAVSPQLADSMETLINRRISFLAQKLPKKPDYLAESVGPDTWTPSDQEIRGWARYVAAAEDPTGVEERLADGTITPEDVEAYREVYPERYQDIRQQIAAKLPELQATLPIQKRMALSMFTDLDIEPALNPIIFARLQAQYGEEPGTDGGTRAPMPLANFSAFGTSRSADKLKTPSQRRAE